MSLKRISVAQIPADLFTVSSLHHTIKSVIDKGERKIFLHTNAHLCQLANSTEKWLIEYFNNDVDYIMCDGGGIQLAARLLRQPVPFKIPYNIWLWKFSEFLSENHYSVFLLGATEEVISKTAKNLTAKNSQLKVAGVHHGYFSKEQNSSENSDVINLINKSGANVLLVGFGMPVQEKWIKENSNNLRVNAIFSCGGAFDFISGKSKVAPYLLRVLYLEWLYRLLADPFRLWKRYLVGNVKFLYYVLKYK